MASEQESSNGPVKKSMREKAIERRNINKEHNSNFKAGYVPIEEERLHKTGLRGRKGNMAICIIVLLFLLALINLIITLVIWTVIRIGPNGCDSMEFHESGLLRFKQKADMGIVHPLHKSTVGGRKDQDLLIVGNNNPVVFQQGTSKLSVEKDKTSVVSDVGITFTDPRTQTTYFSTDFENHEFHLPKGVKVLSVKKASTERITSSASSDLNIKGDSKALIRGNEGVNIMGRTVEFKVGGGIELRAENSIVLNGSVMFNTTRIPNSAGDVYFDQDMESSLGLRRGTRFPVSSEKSGHTAMAVVQVPFLVAVLLLVSPGLQCSSPSAACPESCTCQRAALLNCSSSGLSSVPQHIQDSVTGLDLSQNRLDTVTLHRPYRNLRNVWLENNTITRLSLCIDTNLGTQSVRGRHSGGLGLSSRRRCVSWAPALQLLSIERNQLMQLPEGLERSASLWVLQLSFNRISTLQPGELRHLRQLKELHLKHNLITNLHPQMFQDLAQLRVLDLSFNMLTNLHPSMYLSLRNIGSDVRLDGNRWQCDCGMRSLRRRMAYDSNRGLQTWDMVCAFPSVHSGKDLLQLEEDDLNCFGTENSPEFHRDVTVYSGSEIFLSCSKQDSSWLTPSGQESVSRPQASLLIEQRQYENEAYSESEEPEEIVTYRERRVTFRTVNIGEDINVEYYDTVASGNQQSVEAAKTEEDEHTAGDSGSENGSQQINPENNQQDARDISGTTNTRRKHKVQFDNIPDSEKLEERSLSSCSDSSLSDRELKKDRMNKRDHTSPKSLQRAEDSVQQGADSSTSEIVEVEDWSPHADATRPSDSGLWQENEEQFEFSDSVGSNSARSSSLFGSFNDSRRKVLPTSDIQSRDDVSSCSSSLSADEPTQYTVNPDQEEESTENNHYKSDFTNTKQDASFEQQNSGVDTSRPPAGFNQGNYPHDTLRPAERPEQTSSSQSSDGWPALDLENIPTIKRRLDVKAPSPPPDSSSSSESDDETTGHTEKKRSLKIKRCLDIKAPSPPPDSSSSSDSDDETTRAAERPGKVGNAALPLQKIPTATHDSAARWPAIDLEHIPTIKRRLDVKAPSSPPDSSSSSENEDETTHLTKRPGKVDISQIKKQDLGSSSSSESDDETTGHTEKTIPQKVHHSDLLLKESPTSNRDLDARWPALDLVHIPTIKRRLDIKAPSPSPDSSSSSDSDDETTHAAERPGKVGNAAAPLQKFPTATHDPAARWPAIDLEHIPTIKRRLDVKAPSPPPDSSSSSDTEDETTHRTKRPGKVDISQIKKQDSGSSFSSESDDETTGHTEKMIPQKVHHSGLLLKESPTATHDPDARWPALDLENIPTIKRRLDIKAPSPPPDSSSSSDSDDETIHAAERPGKVGNAALPLHKFPKATHDPDAKWPAIDLEHIPTIKRRLDVKAPSPSPDSSSSSDSEDETTSHTEKTIPQKVHHLGLLLKESQTANHGPDARWPALDLENIPTIKRRLDIKAPSPPPDSSSSSDSDDETTHAAERPGKVGNAAAPLQKFPTATHDPAARWPAIDLEHIPTIKRRLDVKAPSPPPDSSSSNESEDETTHLTKTPGKVDISQIKKQDSGSSPSSESDDETTGHTEKTIPQKVHHSDLLLKESPTSNRDLDARWPALDLENIPTIKRRLDIKAPSPPPDSSSSSDSDDETIHAAERPGKVGNAALPLHTFPTATHDPDARWPAIDLEHIPTIKRRLDVKAPSPSPDSSSSSDSEDETTSHTEKTIPQKVHHSGLLLKESQTANHGPDARWPALDLENIPTIKRCLDIKAPSPPLDSSSSSDSDDETTHAAERPGKVGNAALPLQKFPTATHDPAARWPALDLENIPTIKRRLDVTAPSPHPDSSSSSDTEDETTHRTKRPGKVDISQIKKQDSGSSPSSESDDETTGHIEKKRSPKQSDSVSSSESEGISTEYADYTWRGTSQLSVVPDVAATTNRTSLLVTHAADESRSGTQVARKAGVELKSQASEEGDGSASMWPHLSLTNIPKVKRALDIRAPLQRESFPNCNSEDETEHTVPELKPGVPRINRRLNIKAPSPEPNTSSSSSSESDNESGRPKCISIPVGSFQSRRAEHLGRVTRDKVDGHRSKSTRLFQCEYTFGFRCTSSTAGSSCRARTHPT
ncbi:unnamed protein product [Pleuronectes platessa]|uniref:Beta-sarcoglycan n=1 Tax=Pleuronectes platessa TaxID=8262 RepID=A0A9N7TUM9_PLEPL|nr:unnamed protein product [Pleuronectes platessa]